MPRKDAGISKGTILAHLFKQLCSDVKYQNCWRTCEHWVSIVNNVFPEIEPINLTCRDLYRTSGVDPALKLCFMHFENSPASQLARIYGDERSRVRVFFAAGPGVKVKKPPSMRDSSWWDELRQRQIDYCANNTSLTTPPSERKYVTSVPMAAAIHKFVHPTQYEKKRGAGICIGDANESIPTKKTKSDEIRNQSYFESPEAKSVFKSSPEDESVLTCIDRRIEKLRRVNSTCEGYADIIEIPNNDKDIGHSSTPSVDNNDAKHGNSNHTRPLSDHDKFTIRTKSNYLLILYMLVKDEMPNKTYSECAAMTVSQCVKQGWPKRSHFTLMQWQSEFRIKELFFYPQEARNKKKQQKTKKTETKKEDIEANSVSL